LSKPINADILRSKVDVFIDTFRKTLALAELNEALQREVAERQKAQDALQAANAELERRVQERTLALTRAHQGVRENEERLRMAMQVAQIAAWDWQLSNGRVTWSVDPEQLFGFPAGSFGPQLRISSAVHPDDKDRLEHAVATAWETGTYEADYRAVKPDGSVVWITERGQVVTDVDGYRMVGVSRDVTAEREAALEREMLLKRAREARDEAERQSRLKDDFLATLSHELRTPVNAILGWLSILESGKPIRDTYSALAVIRRNAQIQAKLIEDLLDMNRLLSGSFHLMIGDVDIGALLQTTMQGLQPAADAKGVQLIASVDTGLGQVQADGQRLQQVLWNLVHNAIKFTAKGGRVEIRIQRVLGSVEITVKDNGQGIAADFLPHVFERFRQQDSSSTRESFGLGLGLSIAKHLVELHGGTITAYSPGSGLGASFVVQVPIRSLAGNTVSMTGEGANSGGASLTVPA
jgi:signal transduction histidine kinase